MATAGDNETTFEVVATVDITKLPLTPEEGFVLSRISGRRVTITELSREGVVQPASRAREVIASLVTKGAVAPADSANVRVVAKRDPYAGVLFPIAEMMEAVDLTDEQKKRVLFYEMNLTTWTHYKLIGVTRTAQGIDLKAGYFKVSKEFHPDAYFRKNLGSYKDRLDVIFKAMKAAFDVLADAERRAAYDATVVMELTPLEEEELERLATLARDKRDAEARELRTQTRIKEARLKRNPVVDRLKRGRELMTLAQQSAAAGRHDEAAVHARLAMSFEDSEANRVTGRKFILEAERAHAQFLVKRINQVLASPYDMKDMMDEVHKSAESVADTAAQTTDAALLVDIAKIMQTLKKQPRAAKLAQQAAELAPKNVRAHEIVAEAASADGKWVIAQHAAERWLALDPTATRAKELLKDAKRHK